MQKALEFVKGRCQELGLQGKDIRDALKISEAHAFRVLAGNCLPEKHLRELADLLQVEFEKIICLKYDIPYVEPETQIGKVSPSMRFDEWRATIRQREKLESFDPNI